MEALVLLFGGERRRAGPAGGVGIARKTNIATERKEADFPPCAAFVGPTGKLWAEADREGFGTDPEPTPDEIMAELVKENERPYRTQKCHGNEPDWRLSEHLGGDCGHQLSRGMARALIDVDDLGDGARRACVGSLERHFDQ